MPVFLITANSSLLSSSSPRTVEKQAENFPDPTGVAVIHTSKGTVGRGMGGVISWLFTSSCGSKHGEVVATEVPGDFDDSHAAEQRSEHTLRILYDAVGGGRECDQVEQIGARRSGDLHKPHRKESRLELRSCHINQE